MQNEYYYSTDGSAAFGPEQLSAIQNMQLNGELTGNIQVARVGTQEWMSLDIAIIKATATPKPELPTPNVTTAHKITNAHTPNPIPTEKPIVGNNHNKSLISLLTLLLLVTSAGVGLYAWHTFGAKPPKVRPSVVKWEYLVVNFPAVNPAYPSLDNPSRTDSEALSITTIKIDEKELAILGNQGWELSASFLEMQTAFPNFGKDEYVTGLRENFRPQLLRCIFKRPKYDE